MINKIKRLIRLARITIEGDDQGITPLQQISYLGKSGNGTPWYAYGFHAIAKEDSYTLALAVNGNPEERVHIPTSMINRPKGEPGDVFVFHPETGAKIKFNSSGDIEITSVGKVSVVSPTLVEVTAPAIEHNGNVVNDGTLDVTGDTTLDGALNHDGANAGFYGATPITKPEVTGVKQGGTAQTSLFAALESLGLITDSST